MIVANNYYIQPLQVPIAADLGISESLAAIAAALTQAGYALGLLLILPLGDLMDKRRMLTVLLLLAATMMLAFSMTTSGAALLPLAAAIGISSIVPQILPPAAVQILPPDQRGAAVGRILGGLLLGIILSRFVGGILGGTLGWRWLYAIAAATMIALLILLRRTLPPLPPSYHPVALCRRYCGRHAGVALALCHCSGDDDRTADPAAPHVAAVAAQLSRQLCRVDPLARAAGAAPRQAAQPVADCGRAIRRI
ncbi:major facilitator family protein [Ketogulonicigenium vulgare Y25]|nr:MFS transporter [Ketogulonicigenium vulgare]ADO43084.1 major facilitator family protein [Ketogulonicigenium vulgare Y25]